MTRFLGSFDCGRILNPLTAASQFRGGIVMGLGLALFEETWFDERSGRIMKVAGSPTLSPSDAAASTPVPSPSVADARPLPATVTVAGSRFAIPMNPATNSVAGSW